MVITFHLCSLEDIDQLIAIAKETYFDTFEAMNNPEDMDAYLTSAFDHQKIAAELSNPDSTFLFLFVNDRLAGYLKTNVGQAQTDLRENDGLEIERIYLKRSFQRQGLGKALIHKGLEIARKLNKAYVWLGVWEHNTAAIAFYYRMGFALIGTHVFIMGSDRQTDYIMRKEIDR